MKHSGMIPATLTAVAGFGTMNLLWIVERSRTLHRGLYSYLSSSLGDAFCLPVVVGALSVARVSLPEAPGGMIGGVCGALTLAGVMFATQAAWLADPNPDLNWTLPAPHVFNAAGWYHALFSVCLAGYLGYQLGDMVVRLRKHEMNERTQAALFTATAAGLTFTALLIADNLPNLDRSASRASMFVIGGIAAGMGALLLWMVSRRT
ncbi:hypothetical protein [Raineyella fluvialis]|uniref:Uncharacterized protein n=1 Tax=Raineyella fluvialis TaxID=2662261 RepID=A0A5Q2F688_9ACTN|nr:hypothetical protein [Raineyella fluvialis]QGF22339.1 hypothetical protein Rai3103_00050 [Raineyella fluvialis]